MKNKNTTKIGQCTDANDAYPELPILKSLGTATTIGELKKIIDQYPLKPLLGLETNPFKSCLR